MAVVQGVAVAAEVVARERQGAGALRNAPLAEPFIGTDPIPRGDHDAENYDEGAARRLRFAPVGGSRRTSPALYVNRRLRRL